MSHLLITHCGRCNLLQCIYPTVTHSVAELLFLAPCNALGQHIGKCLTYNTFLNALAGTHLCLRVQAHCNIQELLVQERNAALNTPCCQ